jgi:ABC-2 type transport system permease protein
MTGARARSERTAVVRMCCFHLRQQFRNSYFRQLALTSPLLFVALKYLVARGTGDPIDALTGWEAGVAGMWALTCTASGLVGYQRYQGVLAIHATSPRSPAAVFAPLVVSATGLGLLGLPLAWSAAAALGSVPPIHRPVGVILGLVALTTACAVSAMTFSALFVFSPYASAYEGLLRTPVWLLAGVVIPLNALPSQVRPIALLFPLTPAMQVLRDAAAGHGSIWPWVLGSAVSCTCWLVAAHLGLRTALRYAHRDATLELS